VERNKNILKINNKKKNSKICLPSLPLTVTRYLWATKSIAWPYRGPGPCPCTTTLHVQKYSDKFHAKNPGKGKKKLQHEEEDEELLAKSD
jgi:hypothetical protein